MTEQFKITVDMKVAAGYMEYGLFLLNTSLPQAQAIFEQLAGIAYTNHEGILRLSLVRPASLPNEVLAIKYCTLNELGYNSRVITREIFKCYNLDQSITG